MAGFNEVTLPLFTVDGIHPNQLGGQRLADFLIKNIRTTYQPR